MYVYYVAHLTLPLPSAGAPVLPSCVRELRQEHFVCASFFSAVIHVLPEASLLMRIERQQHGRWKQPVPASSVLVGLELGRGLPLVAQHAVSPRLEAFRAGPRAMHIVRLRTVFGWVRPAAASSAAWQLHARVERDNTRERCPRNGTENRVDYTSVRRRWEQILHATTFSRKK